MRNQFPDDDPNLGLDYLTVFILKYFLRPKKLLPIHSRADKTLDSYQWTRLVAIWFITVPIVWMYVLSAKSPTSNGCELCLYLPWEISELKETAEWFWREPTFGLFLMVFLVQVLLELALMVLLILILTKFAYGFRPMSALLLILTGFTLWVLIASSPKIPALQWLATLSVPTILGSLIGWQIVMTLNERIIYQSNYKPRS